MLSTSAAGLAVGTLLGSAGSLLSFEARLAAASALAVVALLVGTLELTGRRIAPLQCDRETPQPWLHSGALSWAARNGLALSCGATTRIGFWLWYAVPAASLLVGHAFAGAAIYGTYGLVRGLGAWGLIASSAILRRKRGMSFDDIALWLIARHRAAQVVAAGQLLVLGIAFAIAVGV